jgi:hypothetical protein
MKTKCRASKGESAQAGVVVDIYGNKVKQGPMMPLEQRQALVTQFASNGDLFKGRLMTALNKVHIKSPLTIPSPTTQISAKFVDLP